MAASTPPAPPYDTDDTGAACADRFERARHARAAAVHEDYAELIADLAEEYGEARTADIARRLGVTQPPAAAALTRMKRDGLVVARPYRGVFLTPSGAAMAERVKARHQVVLATLKALGVPAGAAEADAEGIEHYVSEETLNAFRRFLSRKSGSKSGARPPRGASRPGAP